MSSARPTHIAVVAVVVLVGVFDVGTGLLLLLSPTPWIAHGPGTIWHGAPGVIEGSADGSALVFSLYRRLGAFSLHAGVVTIAGAWLGQRRRSVMTGLLILWMVSGLSFFATDNAAFAGTDYLRLKQVLGAAWAAALLGHLVDGRRRAADARAA